MVVRSFREEGFGFFFKGWTPAFIRLAPNSMLLFIFLEVCHVPCRYGVLPPYILGYSNLDDFGMGSKAPTHLYAKVMLRVAVRILFLSVGGRGVNNWR